MTKQISYVHLEKQWHIINSKFKTEERILNFLRSGNYSEGPEGEIFATIFADTSGVKYGIGCSSGQDAITLALSVFIDKYKPEECCVILPGNTFIAAALAIKQLGFNLALVDCDEYYQLDIYQLTQWIDDNIDKYQKIFIMPSHLYGQLANMFIIQGIAKRFDCIIIEDASQAHLAKNTAGEKAGSFGEIAAFSCQPTKNLGAAGEAGVVITNNLAYIQEVKIRKNRGLVIKYSQGLYPGWNNRIDEIQAIILLDKLWIFPIWNRVREIKAQWYFKELKGLENHIKLPKKAPWNKNHIYHNFVIRVLEVTKRLKLQKYLEAKGVVVSIHYPIPIHHQPQFIGDYSDSTLSNSVLFANQVLTLPCNQSLKKSEVEYISEHIRKFFNK